MRSARFILFSSVAALLALALPAQAGRDEDKRLATTVYEALGDERILVTAKGSRVHLYGTVEDTKTRRQMADIAQAIPGVERVLVEVDVKAPKARKSDAQMRWDVRSHLFFSRYVDAEQVQVAVRDGVVELTGAVDSEQERALASKNAWDAGARAVINKITVR